MSRNKSKGTAESHQKGMVGEGEFISFASKKGWHIYRGFDGHTPCDYIVDTGDDQGLLRVEVKRSESVQSTNNNYYYVMATKLDTSNFDYIFVSTDHGNYWIPSSECPTVTLSIKVHGDSYQRNITRPGKYERYRVE
jgi:hypothetical protein